MAVFRSCLRKFTFLLADQFALAPHDLTQEAVALEPPTIGGQQKNWTENLLDSTPLPKLELVCREVCEQI